ncbi:hypothetical protein AAEU29_11475 [Pseudoalteromonas sp. SSM20]|uniref:hypothetical protein n=1 Tax=Pseudoalteromonas sp. SSM20 TaxID=3139394 RepID=UPI003BAC9B66
MMITCQYVAKNPDGKFIDITIEIALPEPDPEIGGDSRCKVSIAALELEQYAFGVDDIQAYCLSSKLLQLRLIEKQNQGWQFYYPGYLDQPLDFNNGFF